MSINGLQVRQIGAEPQLNLLGLTLGIFSDNLAKLYIPYTVDYIKVSSYQPLGG